MKYTGHITACGRMLLIVLIACFTAGITRAQSIEALAIESVETEGHQQHGPCITSAEYEVLRQRIKANKNSLIAQGKMVFPEEDRSPVVNLEWPLTHTADFYDFEYYNISNFVDHDPDSSSLLDWNCGNRTYDFGSYDHDGMDIAIGPSGWNMMADQHVHIIAAAPGIIIDKNDGEFDENCALGNGMTANYVILEHADGSQTNYWHMKNGSVTSRDTGEYVKTGEYLGTVASSGQSTGPHLHFEVRDENGDLIDPYAGNCNDINNASWWADQKPYYEPAVAKMITLSSAIVDDPDCGDPDIIPEKNHFVDYDFVRFQFYIRDMLQGDSAFLRVYRPNGTQRFTATVVFNGSYSRLATYFSNANFGNETSGTWKWEITFKGKTYAKYFTIDCTPSYNLTGAHSGRRGYIAGDDITSISTISGSSSNNVLYEAENEIVLQPGFEALDGCIFLAKIDPCTVGGTLAPVQDTEENMSSDMIKVLEVTAFPNPFTDLISVGIPDEFSEIPVQIRLSDALGRIVLEREYQGAGPVEIGTAHLHPGIFWLTVESDSAHAAVKLIK